MNVWNNLVKLSLVRLAKRLREALGSSYRWCVRILRKANRRVIRFSWLRTFINRFLPCPQMVERYIDPCFTTEEFFVVLNQRHIRYTILRWFEDLPNLKKGEDIDMLVHDDDLPKIKDLFVTLPTGIPCDIYSVSAVAGGCYQDDIPLYPCHLAREILETSVMYKEKYRVPDPTRHFLSLAYHALYHKPEESRLALFKEEDPSNSGGQRSYAEMLVRLGERIGVKVSPDLQSLRDLLIEHGWTPRIDVLRRLAERSSTLSMWVTTTPQELLVKQSFASTFDVHGVRVLIQSNCATFMDYVRRDFCFFHKPEEDRQRPQVHVSFVNGTPPWDEIPRSAVPLYKTAGSTVYKQGPNRYVDHDGEVLAVYDLNRDEGTFYSEDPESMYRIAYAMLMTRIGLRLDAMRRHRLHALAIAVDSEAFLFLGDGGCGKTTLGFEMMKHPHVGWLTDDILPIDSDARALAFPTSPRLIEGSAVPWLPPAVTLLKSPMPRKPPKLQLPSWAILSRVCASAKLAELFLCSRRPGVGPSMRRAGFFEAFRGICDNALTGREFGHMKAYHIQFSLPYLCRMLSMYLSRLRTFAYLAWTVPVFRFDMGGQVSENATLLLTRWAARHNARDLRSIDSSAAINSVKSSRLGTDHTAQHQK